MMSASDRDEEDLKLEARKTSSKEGRESWLSSRLKSKEELEDDEDAKFSEDCYSYIAMGCGKGNRIPFLYGITVFLFQLIFLVLMICSKMVRTMSANEDVDNAQKDNSRYVFAQFIPANSTIIVRVTQFLAICAFLFFAEDSVNDVVGAVQFLPLPFWSSNKFWVSVSCFLRFIQGVAACYTALLLVLVSADPIDIVLNFTAVNFISSLDDAAFEIASSGRYGDVLKKKSEDISENIVLDYECLHHMKDIEVKKINDEGEEVTEYIDAKNLWYIPTLLVIAFILLSVTIYVTLAQESNTKWVAQVVRVEFDDDSGLLDYSGCYDFVEKNADRRPRYVSRTQNLEAGELEYCQADRRWVFTKEGGDVCAPHTVGQHLAQSSKTNSFDVSTAFELSWVSPYKKPLDMYFIDDTEESQLFCDEFAADGACNGDLNNNAFQWDGGDCCGTTCNHPSCEKGVNSTVFGQEVFDVVDFPNCINDELMNITFTLGSFDFKDTGDDTWTDFWNPSLKLVCGEEERTVLDIPVSQSMFGESHMIKVAYDEHCTLNVDNFMPYFDSMGVVFSESETISIDKPNDTDIVIDMVLENYIPSGVGSLTGATSLPLAGNFTLEGTIPIEIGNLTSLEQLVITEGDLTGVIPNVIGSLANLTNLDLSSNLLTGNIPPELAALSGLIVFGLGNNDLRGTIPTQLGLLTNLITLDLSNNELTGLVPTELQQLTSLKKLFLNGNQLKGSINCDAFPDIWNVEECQSINSFPRWDSEQPTTSPAPSDSPTISSAPSISDAPTVTAQPVSSIMTDLPSESPTASPSDPLCYSIADILCDANEFVQMCELMRAVEGAEDELSSSNSTFTVFAPTNVGISRYYTENGVRFNFDDVFWFHVVDGDIMFKEDLPCDTGLNLVEMSNGKDSRTLCDRNEEPIGQKGFGNELPIPFVGFDLLACNGVIHTISDVLLSPTNKLN
mmetsp:Transcript_26697/g.62701  ORF Transcript_26697/g.62701 Transcript_26697/m.62701 type:complete len:957 (-) Transcript_26697:114-2984(-)